MRSLGSYRRSGVRARRSLQISPKDVVEEGTRNFTASYKLQMGSASELEYHLLLSKDLNYLKDEAHRKVQAQVEEVKRMLASLIRKVDSERI